MSRATRTMPCSPPSGFSTGEPVTETGIFSPVFEISHDSSRRRTSPSSMRRRTTVRMPELSSMRSFVIENPRSSSSE
jgi:hypothetical protein